MITDVSLFFVSCALLAVTLMLNWRINSLMRRVARLERSSPGMEPVYDPPEDEEWRKYRNEGKEWS